MTRKDPESDLIAFVKQPKSGIIEQTREYQVITPIFGGGVEPQTNDLAKVIRESSIRGHLRFWWRATRGGEFNGVLSDMKAREDFIFGSMANWDGDTLVGIPSQVSIWCEMPNLEELQRYIVPNPHNTRKGKEKEIVPFGSPDSPYGYVAFSLEEGKQLLCGFRFTLQISFPESLTNDVEAALWSWGMFGGIGARTRRGFGALCLLKIDDVVQAPKYNSIQEGFKYVSKGVWPDNIPHLGSSIIDQRWFFYARNDRQANSDILALVDSAWKKQISRYKEFRQFRPHDIPGNTFPGSSRWPEADVIRSLTGEAHKNHSTKLEGKPKKFPRAAFGLPINFQFTHPGDPGVGMPKRLYVLEGTKEEEMVSRWASPLIFRPICFKDAIVEIYVRLQGTQLPDTVVLIERTSEKERSASKSSKSLGSVEIQLNEQEAESIKDPNDKQSTLLKKETDVIQAFFNYLRKGK